MIARTLLAILVAVSCALTACTKDDSQSATEGGASSNGASCVGGGTKAMAALAPFPSSVAGGAEDSGAAQPITGVATFATISSGVDLSVWINGCANGSPYPVTIDEGATCTTTADQGADWDGARGEGISSIPCIGNSGAGSTFYTRPGTDAKPWTVGDKSSSDVVGHVLVVHDPVTMKPIACGPIALEADAGASASASAAPVVLRADVRAQIAGLCGYKTLFASSSMGDCPEPEKLSDCACLHCDLSSCLSVCSDYVTCLNGQPDACANPCSPNEPCAACTDRVTTCLMGFCVNSIACATRTTGGPCSKIEACCAMQGSRAQSCLTLVQKVEKLGGDPTCIGLMQDQDFLTNIAFDPVCKFN